MVPLEDYVMPDLYRSPWPALFSIREDLARPESSLICYIVDVVGTIRADWSIGSLNQNRLISLPEHPFSIPVGR